MGNICRKAEHKIDENHRFIFVLILSVASLFLIAYTLYHWFPKSAVDLYGYLYPLSKSDENRDTGPIGDTFGGTLGPLVALIAAFITFLAFWIQYEANLQQRRDLQIERFENKFYSLIEIHRNNINEIEITNKLKGRKAFVSMFYELKLCYHLVESYHRTVFVKYNVSVSEDLRYNTAYLIFFFGIGPNSSLIIEDLLGPDKKSFFLCAERWFLFHQNNWQAGRTEIAVETINSVFSFKPTYKPFDGHVSRLSHYIRNLFQLVKYVHSSNDKVFNYDDRYNYAATIRSQLSVHEQLLVYYNSVSILGKPWIDEPNLIKEYCLIKSSALTLANFYKNPTSLFGSKNRHGRALYEWDEIKQRINSTS